MDSLHAIGFYVSSGVSLAGGLGVALLGSRDQRGVSLGILGLGLAGIYLTLSAGLAAIVAVVCYLGCAAMFANPQYRRLEAVVSRTWRQVGAVAAGALLAILTYSSFRGDFVHASFYGGTFGAANLGRVFFAHDAIATEAVAAIVFAALAGAAAAWRMRERGR
jgi:NADH:ubiquinone oxidoreductase subunit 6 (subunit J)